MTARDHAQSNCAATPKSAASEAGEPWTCPSCYQATAIEVVQIRQPDRSWVDSSVRRCTGCKHTFGGSLEDRLAYIRDTYAYKYFGDYEMTDAQLDAIWEANVLACMVPALVAALTEFVRIDGFISLHEMFQRDWEPAMEAARAAIAPFSAKPTRGEGSRDALKDERR
jgi:hypothetical protein